jgi:imidazolonepropionase-like amidohydrolase
MLITNIRLFDGTDDSLIEDASVWVEDNIIRYAGPSKDIKNAPESIKSIDGNGLFVMPGMVESHAHISYTNNGPTELDKTPVEEAMIKSVDCKLGVIRIKISVASSSTKISSASK